MRLNADIIYQNLKNYIEVSFNGDSVRELVLLRPEFYLDGQKEFLSGHVYVCSADHLPEEPAIEENVLLICLGSRTPTAFFYRGCSILSVPEDENIFRVFNLVQDVFNRYEAWEGRLNEVLRGSASLQEMLDLSKDIFNNPLLLIGSDFNYLAYTDKDYLKDELGMNLDGPTFDPDLMATFLSLHEIATNIREPLLMNLLDSSTLSVNIFDKNEFLGCITILGGFRQIRPSDSELCVYFSEMLRQAFLRSPQLAGEHAAMRLAVRDIVNGQPVTSEQRSIISRYNFKDTLCFAVLQSDDDSATLPRGYVSSLIEQQIPGALSFEHDTFVCAIISAPADDYRSALNAILTPITKKMRITSGISHMFEDLFDCTYAYFQAGAALEHGLKSGRTERIFFYEDYILQQLLSHATGNVPVRFFYTDGLTRLWKHDISSQVSYIDTLRTYLDCNKSISATARTLHLHRSSLIDRLNRIDQILGCDLNDPEERLKLQIVLHKMTQKT